MADFGVAHLSFRQADIEAARTQSAARIFAIESDRETAFARAEWHRRLPARCCPAAGIDSPAVANQQHHRLRHDGELADEWSAHKQVLSLTRRSAASTSPS